MEKESLEEKAIVQEENIKPVDTRLVYPPIEKDPKTGLPLARQQGYLFYDRTPGKG